VRREIDSPQELCGGTAFVRVRQFAFGAMEAISFGPSSRARYSADLVAEASLTTASSKA
jgi:hypothetical protein